MPVLTFDIKIDPVPDVKVWVVAYKAKEPATIVAFQDFDPPHINPRGIEMYVPTYDVYLVQIYKGGSTPTGGIFLNDFTVRPRADIANIPPDVYIEVGRGQPQDPADGAGFVILPGTEGMNISRIDKVGVGPLPPEEWQQISGTDGNGDPAIGVDLLDTDEDGNPIVFNLGERFRIVYAITVDGNAGEALLELTDALNDHIADTSNPHQVTKQQVGLGNIPNSVSNNWQAPSSGTLATTQAVYDAVNSITSPVKGKGVSQLITIGATNSAAPVITHGIAGLSANNYWPIITLVSSDPNNTQPGNYSISWAIQRIDATSFQLRMVNRGSSTANVYARWVIIA